MNTPDVDAGRLERRVRRVGGKTMPGFLEFCSFYSFGAICGVPLFAPYCVIRLKWFVSHRNLRPFNKSNAETPNR